MPIEPLPNNGTQIERALRAWFIAHAAGTKNDLFISNDSRDRPQILTDIFATSSRHDPENTGNEIWSVSIQNKFPAAIQPGQNNPEAHRVAIDARVGLQMAALAQTDDNCTLNFTAAGISTAGRSLATAGSTRDQANNADMADFTCLFVRYLGASRGRPDDDSCSWVEVRNYEITACPYNVD